MERVEELIQGLYPDEPTPNLSQGPDASETRRQTQACLFARTIICPSCEGTIPLSPNWRLDSKGTGLRVVPDIVSGTCSFQIVTRASDQSPGTISSAKATCPFPNCGATTPAGYISQEAQGGRLGHQLYCIIYRDSWYPTTKSGRGFPKAPKTSPGIPRIKRPDDDNTEGVAIPDWPELAELLGAGQHSPHRRSSPRRRPSPSPVWNAPLAGHVQPPPTSGPRLLRPSLPRPSRRRPRSREDSTRSAKAAWCYIALAMDKMINRNSLISSVGFRTKDIVNGRGNLR